MPQWKGSNRKGRLPADWDRLRVPVLKRCGYRCEWVEDGIRCHLPATDVDHIIPGDDHRGVNLQGLCAGHHLSKTGREARAAQLERKKLLQRPAEPQPGIIKGPPQPPERKGF